MRSVRLALAVTLASGLILVAPAGARAGGPARRAGPDRAAERASTRRPGRFRRAMRRVGDRLRGRQQHAYFPLRTGSERTFTITSEGRGVHQTSEHTERVTAVERRGGLLRAQVESTWTGSHGTSVTQHVAEVGRKGLHMAVTDRLDSAPAPGTRVEGIGLPRRLRVGKSWSNRISSENAGYKTVTDTTSRVTRKVRQKGPDGRLHRGFVIESQSTSTMTAPDGTVHRTSYRQQATYLKGIGEVESTNHQEGGSVTRRLIGFKPGAD